MAANVAKPLERKCLGGRRAGLGISDLEVDNSPHILTAGTYGRGAWQTTLSTGTSNQPPTANFTSSTSGLTARFPATLPQTPRRHPSPRRRGLGPECLR